MKKSRYTEGQIVKALKEEENGRCVFGQQNAQRCSFKKVAGTGDRRTVVTFLV
jgi:hypothetical protein